MTLPSIVLLPILTISAIILVAFVPHAVAQTDNGTDNGLMAECQDIATHLMLAQNSLSGPPNFDLHKAILNYNHDCGNVTGVMRQK